MNILNSLQKFTKRDFLVGLLAIAIVQLPQVCAAYITLIQVLPKAEVEQVCQPPR